MKYLIVNGKRKIKGIINYLIQHESLPQIQRRLNIFAVDNTFQIEILNNKISLRKNDRSKSIYIKNKNIKYFFKMLDNTKKYYINDIAILKFKSCSLLFDTYHGTIISLDDNSLCSDLKNKFNLLCFNNINEHKFIISS